MLGFHGMKAYGNCGGKAPHSLHFAARWSPLCSKCLNTGKTALVPTDGDKSVPQMVCAGKERESLYPFQEPNLGHPDCNLTLPLTNNLISLTKARNNRTKDNST